ncbi:MAG: xanthine dehydrogenase molybdopterin binding subunit [Bacteriovoracaceae bacterium]
MKTIFKNHGSHHDSGVSHVKGESAFIDDRPMVKNEMIIGFLGTPVAKGLLIDIDCEEAKKIPGVLGIFTHKDVHHNHWGTIIPEQPFLVQDKIGHIDEPIAIIAVENNEFTKETLRMAKASIKLLIKEETALFDLDQAIKEKSFIGQTSSIKRGDPTKAFHAAPHKLTGFFENEGQEHFYLESQAAIAYPLEQDQVEIHSSSQHPTEVQHLSAEVLGIPFHQVVSIVKRMGGGFGGKESQAAPFAAMAALAAHKLKRPARLILSKDDDMKSTGKRHPFKNFYQVGFDHDGKILSLKVDLYSNAGAYADLSPSIMERAMLHLDGAYYLPDVEINGTVCRTNVHSHTAFRGFGGPQGTATIESILEDIARILKKDSFHVRRINVYGKDQNNVTPYGQVLTFNPLPELFDQLYQTSDYQKRKKEIEAFNKESKTHLKGLSMTSTKFGIAFTAKFLNQGNALVNVHLDGTVQVSTGATEMGQGVNSKMQKIAADELGVLQHQVRVMPTSTEKNHNTSPTAASSGSDINGAAVSLAAQKIRKRLAQVALHFFTEKSGEVEIWEQFDDADFHFENNSVKQISTNKTMPLKELLNKAYLNRVQLGDYAFYKTPGLSFDKEKGFGRAFNYFTNGVAVSEVLIDRLTGELKVTRADLLMDLGRPINRAIDIGQVTGAYVQAQGWVTTEKLVYNEKGTLLSHSPTTYKIPNIQDMPRIFNVDLLENENEGHSNIKGSKAVGEPPFLLGISVWTAVKHALSFITEKELPQIKLPATSEEILMEIERLKTLEGIQ